MRLLKIDSPQVKKYLNNAAFLSRMRQPVKVSDKYDIPYLAGYSKDGETVYFDRHLKKFWRYKGRTLDVRKFIILHEIGEKALIDLFGLHYQVAHHIVTWGVEFPAVKAAGVDWNDYSKFLAPQIKSDLSEKIKIVPSDLDLTPYSNEGQKKLEVKMEKKMSPVKIKEKTEKEYANGPE
jgi:hypothetical protein